MLVNAKIEINNEDLKKVLDEICKKKYIKKLEDLEEKLEKNIKSVNEEIDKKVESMFENIKAFFVDLINKNSKKTLESVNIQLSSIREELAELKSDNKNLKEALEESVKIQLSPMRKELTELKSDIRKELTELKSDNKNLKEALEESVKIQLSSMREELAELKSKKISNLENENKNIQKEINKKDILIIDLQKEIKSYKDEVMKLKELTELKSKKISNLENENKNLQSKLKECKDEISELEKLREYKEVFEDEKLNNLLNAILKNNALVKFREDNNIKDISPKSIMNLVKFLKDERVFVNSIYNYILEYKRENQTEMSDEEIEFYNAVNDYFGKEVFFNIYKHVKEDKFDKSIHRGINGETRGELSDDKLVLIPSSNVDGIKMKVKMK
jgi:DNA repair exonuclease SbcCD ATPase subunit